MTIANTNVVAKVAAVVAGLGLVLASFAPIAKADTTSDLQAQIASLLAQISSLQAQLGGSTTTTSSSMMFSMDLKVGSTGASVTALQNWLISKGFTISAGATGYFGAQTKAALAAYQSANGISPAVGYFGPITRAKVNAAAGGTTTTTTTGGTTTTTTTGGGITTVGVEGNINIEKETSGIKTNLYEGDMKATVLGVRVEAKNSDVIVNRVRVSLGTTTDTYTKLYSKVYVMDASGNILASQSLDSSSVTRVSGTPPQYYVTLTGLNYLIKKDMKKSLYVAVDLYPSISSQYQGSKTFSFYDGDAIRATDGAGIDQYSTGAGSITQSVSVSSNLSDSATLTVSTDPSVRKATTIVANKGANNNEVDKEEVGSFRLLAEKDSVLMRDINVTVSNTATTSANLQTLYLFDGSTQVGSASGDSNGLYSFTSVNQTLTKDAYKTYTLKADFRSVTSGAVLKVGAVNVTSAESVGTGRTITTTSLAAGAGENMTLVSQGVVLTLGSSDKSIAITSSKSTAGSTTEAHLTATFNLNLTAIGADATFGNASSTGVLNFVLLKNGISTTTTVGTRTAYYPATQPTGTTNYSVYGFTIPRNATVTIPVTFKVDANTSAAVDADLTAGNYSVRLNGVTYTSNGVSVTNDYSTNVNYVTAEAQRP
jgi:hypothetical protein